MDTTSPKITSRAACYRLSANNEKILPGIHLWFTPADELDGRTIPALRVGSIYVYRDWGFRNETAIGCLYKKYETGALMVRQAQIKYQKDTKGKMVPRLVAPYKEHGTALLDVNLKVGSRGRMWRGILAGPGVNIITRSDDHYLLEFDRDGQQVVLFLGNGDVKHVACINGLLVNAGGKLSDEAVTGYRIAYIKGELAKESTDGSPILSNRRYALLRSMVEYYQLLDTGAKNEKRKVLKFFAAEHKRRPINTRERNNVLFLLSVVMRKERDTCANQVKRGDFKFLQRAKSATPVSKRKKREVKKNRALKQKNK